MVPRAILLQDLHSGPGNRVTSRERKRVDVAVGTRGSFAENLAELVVFNDPHRGFGVADGATVRQEDFPGRQVWFFGLQVPFTSAFESHFAGAVHDRYMPLGAAQRSLADIREPRRADARIAAHVE